MDTLREKIERKIKELKTQSNALLFQPTATEIAAGDHDAHIRVPSVSDIRAEQEEIDIKRGIVEQDIELLGRVLSGEVVFLSQGSKTAFLKSVYDLDEEISKLQKTRYSFASILEQQTRIETLLA